MGNWSDIPWELLVIIAGKIKRIEDFVAFRGVCSSWRSAAPKQNFTGTTQLACALHARKVVPLSKAAVYLLQPRPSLSVSDSTTDKTILARYYYFEERYFASKGWWFAISRNGDTCLFHPLSRAQIRLPHVSTLPKCHDRNLFSEVVLSSSPSVSSNYALIVRIWSGLAFWKPGKDVFTEIVGHYKPFKWFSICCSNTKLYTLDASGIIVIWDMKIGSDDVPVVLLVMKSASFDRSSFHIDPCLMLLVESENGEVFTVGRSFCDRLIIHRIDVTNKECVHVEDLRNKALFFGLRARLCFFMDPGEIPECMPDHIYLDETRVYYKGYLESNTKKTNHAELNVGFIAFQTDPLIHSSTSATNTS